MKPRCGAIVRVGLVVLWASFATLVGAAEEPSNNYSGGVLLALDAER